MLLVGEIMQAGPPCADAGDTVVVVAGQLRDHRLDQIPVCRGGAFVGIVCETDIVRRCVARGLDPAGTEVGDLVTPDDAQVQADLPAEEALLAVLHTGCRCLAVLQGDRLVGLVTQADLVEALPESTVGGILAVVSRT